MLGESKARGILDMVRAARPRYPDKIGRRFQIVGHSQGGQAALFGAHHAPSWTPELELLGVGAIAPASAPRTLMFAGAGSDQTTGGYAFTALFLAGAVGGDPTINPAEVLSDKAFAFWPHVEERARGGLSDTESSWGSLKGTEQFRPEGNASKAAFFRQLERMHPALPITVPIRIAQSEEDTRIKSLFTGELVNHLRFMNGDERVTYRLYRALLDVNVPNEPGELGHHFGSITADTPYMAGWLDENFKRTS